VSASRERVGLPEEETGGMGSTAEKRSAMTQMECSKTGAVSRRDWVDFSEEASSDGVFLLTNSGESVGSRHTVKYRLILV